MNVTVAKKKAYANVKAKMNVKVVRKPLGDLTNRPRALEKPSKKNSVRENYDWVKEEGFLHNHDKCIECANATMIKDILPQCSPPVKLIRMELDEFLTPVKLVEFDIDLFAGCSCSPARPPTPGSPLLDIDPYWYSFKVLLMIENLQNDGAKSQHQLRFVEKILLRISNV